MNHSPLFVRATTPVDLPLISGFIQDAMFPIMDTQYIPSDTIFVMVLNRFVWERENPPLLRTHTILHFDNVLGVASQHLDISAQRVYTILSIIPVLAPDNTVYLHLSLAGGETIRLHVRTVDIVIKDVGIPWHTLRKPSHDTTVLQQG